MQKVDLLDLVTIGYAECLDIQRSIFDSLVSKKQHLPHEIEAKDATLILCEHPHVYTLGKSGSENNMLITESFLEKIGATFHKTDRGGDITYHGPGQLVGYPILDLEQIGIGLKQYIFALEQTIIDTLSVYHIEAERDQGATGVWLQPKGNKGLRKIAAIGVRSSHFVTMHGFSFNVSPAMEYFSYINPCGFTDRGVTSIESETGITVDMQELKTVYTKNFEKVFGVAMKKMK